MTTEIWPQASVVQVDISLLVLVIHIDAEDIHMQPHNLRINVDKMICAADDTARDIASSARPSGR